MHMTKYIVKFTTFFLFFFFFFLKKATYFLKNPFIVMLNYEEHRQNSLVPVIAYAIAAINIVLISFLFALS